MRDANCGSGMTPLIAEQFGHEIGRAVHRLGQGVEARFDAEEPPEPHHLLHSVEIAKRRMRLGKHVDRAEVGGLTRGVDSVEGLERVAIDELEAVIPDVA